MLSWVLLPKLSLTLTTALRKKIIFQVWRVIKVKPREIGKVSQVTQNRADSASGLHAGLLPLAVLQHAVLECVRERLCGNTTAQGMFPKGFQFSVDVRRRRQPRSGAAHVQGGPPHGAQTKRP